MPKFFYFFLFLLTFLTRFFSFATENTFEPNSATLVYNLGSGFSLINPTEGLTIGGYIQFDGRCFIGAEQNTSTFLIRRARIFLTGTLYKHFGFMIMPRWDKPEFGELHYAWLETNFPDWAKMRVGLFKEPFSLESITPDITLNFVERSLIIRNLSHIEDIGIMLFGNLLKDKIEYGIGCFNGRRLKYDNNNNKEVVGRIVFSLFNKPNPTQIYIGLSGATGRYDENLSNLTFQTESDTIFWEWSDSSYGPVRVHSNRLRLGADLQWLVGPFSFTAEGLYTSWGKIRNDLVSRNFYGYGGYCDCSYLLTGEDKPRFSPVIPKHNFDFCGQYWGAFEIAARYELLKVSKEMLEYGLAIGANFLHGPILAFNWYLNPLICLRLDGQYLRFNKEVKFDKYKIRHESVITLRVQGLF